MDTLAVTPDNRYLIFPNPNHYGDVKVAEFDTMAQVRTIKLRSGSHRAICIVTLPDNQHVVIQNHDAYHQEEDTLEIFDLLTGECVSQCSCEAVGNPQVTPNGRYVVFTAEFGYSVVIWDWQAGSKAHILFSQGLEECFVEALNSDGNKVVVTHYPAKIWPVVKEHQHPTLRIWDLLTGLQTCSFPGYKSAAALPDKHKIMTIAEKTGALTILDIEKGQVETVLDDVATPNSRIEAITPDGQYAIVSLYSPKREVATKFKVWNLETGKLDHVIPWMLYEPIAMTADGRYILKPPGDERWDLQKKRLVVVS
jgi:WD40 repeat protein